MKKVVSVVAALVMCLAMSVTCFAASPVKVTAKSSNVTVDEVSTEQATAIKAIAENKESLKAVLGNKFTEAATVVSYFDLEGTAGEVELNVTGIASGDSVVVLHWVNGDMTAAPEVLSATAGDGTITFNVSSFSPFAIVKLASATGSASPKTGETTMAVMALMLISAAGILVLNRKKIA